MDSQLLESASRAPKECIDGIRDSFIGHENKRAHKRRNASTTNRVYFTGVLYAIPWVVKKWGVPKMWTRIGVWIANSS
jgi:hypothetical protein